MKFWTVHLRRTDEPVLVREGFSWGALFFGWLWLLVHRAWIAGVLLLVLTVLAGIFSPDRLRIPVLLAIAILQGLHGNDLLRWSLERRGYLLAHVVSGSDEESALARLLRRRPDLVETLAP